MEPFTVIYLMVLDDCFYVGYDSTGKRIDAHKKGRCKTTAPLTKGHWPLMVPMIYVDKDDARRMEALVGDGLRDLGWPIINKHFPHCFTDEDRARGHVSQVINGTGFYDPDVIAKANARSIVSQRKNKTGVAFDPELRQRGIESQRRNGTGVYDPGLRVRNHETMRNRGTGVYDPRVRAKGKEKGLESQRKNGTGVYDQDARSRGQTTHRKNGTGVFDPKVRAKGIVASHHSHWHVKRRLINGDCSLCAAAVADGEDWVYEARLMSDVCIANDCYREADRNELCGKHYQRQLEARKKQEGIICIVFGCGGPLRAKGFCNMHYQRQRKVKVAA